MAKTKKQTFLLAHYFDRTLSQADIVFLDKDYKELLRTNQLTIPQVDTLKLMLWSKREEVCCGPYINLSFFEISNRIYSDLVLIEAAQKLFTDHSIRTIRLNMSNKGGNDIIVIDKTGNEVLGEAFNTATSFFQIKFRTEIKKFEERTAGFVAFNRSALDDSNKYFLDRQLKKYPNVTPIICEI